MQSENGDDVLIIEINKAKEFSEFHRMNNSDEIIEANPTLAGRQLASSAASYGFNEPSMSFVCENAEESDNPRADYYARSIIEHRQQATGIDLAALSPPKVSELIMYDNGDYPCYQPGYTNSLIEYDDLYVDQHDGSSDRQNDSLSNGQIEQTLVGQSLIDANLFYNKELLSDDLDLSTLIVPPPPKLDSNLEEQDELLRNFQKATDELKNICQSCQNGNAVPDLDYTNCFGSNGQVARDLHSSSSSADSGYESVLLINNSAKLVNINQKLISSNLSSFTRPDQYVLGNHCTISQPPKAPPRFNKLKGN